MNQHQLLLLTPYQFPAADMMVLGDEDMKSWMNAYSALWHPAMLWLAASPPRVEEAYDHEEPAADFIYAIPEAPPMMMPEDWADRACEAGAITFEATTERESTLANVKQAIRDAKPDDENDANYQARVKLLDLPKEKVAPFYALGLGYLLLSALSEGMEHENLLESEAFWDDVQMALAELTGVPYTPVIQSNFDDEPAPPDDYDEQSAPIDDYADPSDPDMDYADSPDYEDFEQPSPDETQPEPEEKEDVEPWYGFLQTAAEKQLSAREVLYPVTIYLLDLLLLEEKHINEEFPTVLQDGLAVNVISSASLLEKMAGENPARFADLRDKVQNEQLEICGGCYVEREDAMLPFDSQIWNLRKGQKVTHELLGTDVQVYARKRFAFHPQMPLLLSTTGITRALLLTFDESSLPEYHSSVVSWPSPDGKQIDAYVREPFAADNAQTFFNLGYYLFKTTREDHTATIAFLHSHTPALPWYGDLLELSRLTSVIGQWTRMSSFFDDGATGDYSDSVPADDFHFDYLNERITADSAAPVSGFGEFVQLRRHVDACWTFGALLRSLAGTKDFENKLERLSALEDEIEIYGPNITPDDANREKWTEELHHIQQEIGKALCERLQARADENETGYMILNPCGFKRRVTLELENVQYPLPVEGAVKSCQLDDGKLKAVVEVSPLGFTWIPKEGTPTTPMPAMRLRLAEKTTLRNEFFEVDLDPKTGGLRAIRDQRTLFNRISQRLVFNPGSVMRATNFTVTSQGPALGEIIAEGELVGEKQQVLAKFRQRYRVWLGRPMLDLRIELDIEQPPAGYPWHAFFGSRFAWGDDRAWLVRGVNGTGYVTAHQRPQTSEYLEVRYGHQNVVILPGGLPFHQRFESRMVDVILVTEGESRHTFDLGIALDRDQPAQTALGLISPAPLISTTKGPPHIGETGWLFHLDAPNVMITRMTPGGVEQPLEGDEKRDLTHAITARLMECGGHSGQAELRCVRDPKRAVMLDARGELLMDATPAGDAVMFEVMPGDYSQMQVEF